MDVGGLHFTYANVALFGVALFLLMGVISFARQGLRVAAVVVGLLSACAAAGGVMWL